jgi:YHS domain-containing protein
MEALIYFALWAGLIFLMMRFGCGAHVMGHGRHGGHGRATQAGGTDELTWVPPEKDVDPVCGKTVATGKAKPSVHKGAVHYFCSGECREVFEAAPELYAGGDQTPPQTRRLEHSRV